jgi:serine/threonine protein kinase
MPSTPDESMQSAGGDRARANMYCPACAASMSSIAETCPHDGARLIEWDPLCDPLLGETLDGRYRVLDCIAVGDASILYRGVQLTIDRPIAIKVLRFAGEPVATMRFVREAQILKNLSHPNIVHIYDVGQTAAGDLYFVLELLRGKTLGAEIARVGRFDVQRACEVAIQLCHALTAAHALGVVHRDLNPSNIMLLEDAAVLDLVKVLDFGLARPGELSGDDAIVTLAGAIVGTPRYVAPEALFSRGTVDPRSDLFSLGCVMRDMLAGCADPRFEFAARQPPTPPRLPSDTPRRVAHLVRSLLSQAPEHRPDAPTVAKELQQWLDEDQARIAATEANTLVSDTTMPVADRPTLMVVQPERRPRTEHRVLPPTPLLSQPIPRIAPPPPLRIAPPPMQLAPQTPAAAQYAPLVYHTSRPSPITARIDAHTRWMLIAAMVLVALGMVILIGLMWP